MKKIAVCSLIVGLLLSISLVVNYYLSDARRELLPPNTIVGGVDIGNLTVEEANDRIFETYSDYTVSIYDSFTQTELVFGDNVGLWLDFSVAVNEIYMQKSAPWVLDLWGEYVSDADGIIRLDTDLLMQFVQEYISVWNAGTKQQKDAYIVLSDDCFEAVNEETGTLLEYLLVYNLLLPAIYERTSVVDFSICTTPFYGITADDLSDVLSHLNTFAGFRLEYETGEVINFRYLVENDWLIFGGAEVKFAEYKAIEHVAELGNGYDTDSYALDKASESVQLIADIYNKEFVSRSMVFTERTDIPRHIEYPHSGDGIAHIGLSEFLDDLGLSWNEYLDIADTLENWEYPHYISGNAFRYAEYWSLNPDMSADTVFALVNVNADLEPYTGISEVYEPDNMWLLVNKHYKLPSDYAPDDLSRVDGSWLMRDEAARAFISMRSDMRGQGLNVFVTSAYRSYRRQDDIHRGRVRSYGIEQADMEAARAGHSEHNAGLAIDFFHRADIGRAQNANFQNTAHFGWLTRYAYYYGFILRYPEEYLNIHRNIFEPWHWRYVGVEIATAMRDRDIALYEEFYGKYLAPEVLYVVKQLILEQREQGEIIEFEQYIQKTA